MGYSSTHRQAAGSMIGTLAALGAWTMFASAAHAAFIQTNLVSNIPGMAVVTDLNLRNPWGITASATSPFWVSDNGTGVSTLYNTAGTPQSLVVTIPNPGGGQSAPTGTVFNSSGTAFNGDLFLFATEDGTIAGWRGALGTNAEILVNGPPGASYKGIAVSGSGAAGTARLYAADFANARIFETGAPITGNFTDPTLPSGYSPFNIQNLGNTLYVTYAKHDTGSPDEQAGPGFGFVDAFDLNGNLVGRVASDGDLNAPWGLALTPAAFGAFPAGTLLVGNFGDGLIHAYNLAGGSLGALTDALGNPIQNDGLWGLRFGNGGNGGLPGVLYFAAGINGENDGLFGSISSVGGAVPEPGTMYLLLACVLALAGVSRARRAFPAERH